MEIAIAVMVLVLLAASVVAIVALPRRASPAGIYRARQLMTENEAEFFGRLVVALPDYYIFPQVAMGALIEAASGDRKKAHGDRLRIAQQRTDYVVCDRRCKVVAVVELDDRTHSAARDAIRDGRLQQAGLCTVRFQSRSKPSVEALRAAVLSAGAAAVVPMPGMAA